MEHINTKINAAIKLGLWGIFIMVLIVFSILSKNNTSEKKQIKEDNTPKANEIKSYDVMQQELLNGNYEYNYVINTNDIKYKYKGNKCNDKDIGYKETNDSIIKYLIEEDKYYKLVLDNKEEYNDLYLGLNKNYFNFKYLFQELNNTIYKMDKTDDGMIINYDNSLKVITNLNNITEIIIEEENVNYRLNFFNYGYCDNGLSE